MRLLKLGLFSFGFIFILLLLISLLFPSHIRLSKATNLPNNRPAIFALLQNDSSWHPAYKDTSTATAFAAMKKQVLQKTDSTLVVRLQQANREPVISGWQLYGDEKGDSLTLQWYMDFRLGWLPWQKFSALFYESSYGAMMEKGLAALKQRFTQ